MEIELVVSCLTCKGLKRCRANPHSQKVELKNQLFSGPLEN